MAAIHALPAPGHPRSPLRGRASEPSGRKCWLPEDGRDPRSSPVPAIPARPFGPGPLSRAECWSPDNGRDPKFSRSWPSPARPFGAGLRTARPEMLAARRWSRSALFPLPAIPGSLLWAEPLSQSARMLADDGRDPKFSRSWPSPARPFGAGLRTARPEMLAARRWSRSALFPLPAIPGSLLWAEPLSQSARMLADDGRDPKSSRSWPSRLAPSGPGNADCRTMASIRGLAAPGLPLRRRASEPAGRICWQPRDGRDPGSSRSRPSQLAPSAPGL